MLVLIILLSDFFPLEWYATKYLKAIHGGRRENAWIFRVRQFLWEKSCHKGGLQATNVMSLSSELGRGANHWLSQPVSENISCLPMSHANLLLKDPVFLT